MANSGRLNGAGAFASASGTEGGWEAVPGSSSVAFPTLAAPMMGAGGAALASPLTGAPRGEGVPTVLASGETDGAPGGAPGGASGAKERETALGGCPPALTCASGSSSAPGPLEPDAPGEAAAAYAAGGAAALAGDPVVCFANAFCALPSVSPGPVTEAGVGANGISGEATSGVAETSARVGAISTAR